MRTMDPPQTERPHAYNVKGDAEKAAGDATTFFAKINADWIFTWSGTLAYSFLTSIFPLMLVILAIAGLLLGALSPATYHSLENSIAGALPSGIGHTIVSAAITSLQRNAGVILIIGVITAIFGGSRLFVAIENAFGAVLRLHPRSFIQQNLVAILMTLVFAVGGPLLFLAGIIPTLALKSLSSAAPSALTSFIVQVIGLAIGFLVAAVLFGAIYVVMPNQKVDWHDVWKGSVVAAALLVVYELLFPIYESFLLHPGNYGSLAGFAILLLVFFYYLSFILLLGVEINAWQQGQRTATDELVIFTKPEEAAKTAKSNKAPSVIAQRPSKRPSAISRLTTEAESATAAITYHESGARGGQAPVRPQPNQHTKGSQRRRYAPPTTRRAPTTAYSATGLSLDEPTAAARFSLTTGLATALTALTVIAFQLARRPRHA